MGKTKHQLYKLKELGHRLNGAYTRLIHLRTQAKNKWIQSVTEIRENIKKK